MYGIVAIYTIIVLLFSLPPAQRALANCIADVLSETLGTSVRIGSVNLGFLTRIIINDVEIEDQHHNQMLSVSRLSASVSYTELLRGSIYIHTAQLFSPNITVYRDSISDELNCQFIIDALKSDSKEPSETNLHINSIIMRHANVSYDDQMHLRIKDAGLNASLKVLTNDSINLIVKRLNLQEDVSGFNLKELRFSLEGNNHRLALNDFAVRLNHSSLSIDSVLVDIEDEGRYRLYPTLLTANVIPSDFGHFVPQVANLHTPIGITARALADSTSVSLPEMHIRTADDHLNISLAANANHQTYNVNRANVNINYLHANADFISDVLEALNVEKSVSDIVSRIGDVEYNGSIAYEPSMLRSDGQVFTPSGIIDYEGTLDTLNRFDLSLEANSLKAGHILDNENWGNATVSLAASGSTQQLSALNGKIDLVGDAIGAQAEVEYTLANSMHNVRVHSDITNFMPQVLGLVKLPQSSRFAGNIDAELCGNSIDDTQGYVTLHNLAMKSDTVSLSIDDIKVVAERILGAEKHYAVISDVVNADLQGTFSPSKLPGCVMSILSHHLPDIIPVKPFSRRDTDGVDMAYSIDIVDHPLIHYLTGDALSLGSNLYASGYVNSDENALSLQVEGKRLRYGERQIHNLRMLTNCNGNDLKTSLSGITATEGSAAHVDFAAHTDDGNIISKLQLQHRGKTDVNMELNNTFAFGTTNGVKAIDISFDPSILSVNDTLWSLSPSHISICGKEVEINNLKIGNGTGYLAVNGKTSQNSNDSIVAEINNMPLDYILEAVDFTSVQFGGNVTGKAIVKNIMSGSPDLNAGLNVRRLTFETGVMGDAAINGRWDNEKGAIMIDADIYDNYTSPTPFSISDIASRGRTQVHGFVSPKHNNIKLDITAQHTPVLFLNGFLDNVFNPISGYLDGEVSVVGPLDMINLIGEADVDLSLSLLATDVPYTLKKQHVVLKDGEFCFNNITLTDRFGNNGTLNGRVTHRNLANFAYDFDVNFNRLLAYEETKFNADKFYATVFADGNLNIHGRDGHPMYMTANITPTRGSVFAYDTATPDAITNSSFITFHDATPVEKEPEVKKNALVFDYFNSNDAESTPTFFGENVIGEPSDKEQNYHGDLYIDFNINLNEDCRIRLRMDNTDDGYIDTYGTGQLAAKYYNKGSLELFGIYNINKGSYRLYLQNLVFRDLVMQPGSSVEFNGSPFDANIHLLFNHVIQSVPVSDLTSAALSSNNKVRVNCILDISGNLSNMDLKFDLDILNANDEIKQLVHSMINSEEEMNTQTIYLLTLGRFYPTGYANRSDNTQSSSAVNSLMSSTISGQLNNMIGSLMGNNSNWNFGTGITTGEKGWSDMDIEGILSGQLFDDRLLFNGNFGYRDNAFTNQGVFVGDFEVKWRLKKDGNLYIKGYNQTNDRYFTKATLNTQGIGLNYQKSFENWKSLFSIKKPK